MSSKSFLEVYKDNIDYITLSAVKQKQDAKLNLKINQKYARILGQLPKLDNATILKDGSSFNIQFEKITDENQEIINQSAKEIGPWRKGPFKIGKTFIDSEWRSNLKWDRIKNSLPPLTGKKILDIGCNNGYFMFKMAEQNPEAILGIDPVPLCWGQYQFIKHFSNSSKLFFEMFGIEHIKYCGPIFDVILNMGIIYHHRNPIAQLQDIHHALKAKGTLILESIIIPGEDSTALFPEKRYAQMKNVWFVPTTNCLINWLRRTHFTDIEVIAVSDLNDTEQRVTEWSSKKSLNDFLDPINQNLTIEGYPAPKRVCIKATKS